MDKSVETAGITASLAVGIIGTGSWCLAYPLHQSVIRKRRAKIAPQILKLSDEIAKNV